MRPNKIIKIDKINNYAIIAYDNNKYFYIDLEDIDRVIIKNWIFSKGNRVFCKENGKIIELTKYIMNTTEKVYKVNNKKPDFRKNNLSIGIKGNIIKKYSNYAKIFIDKDYCVIDLDDVEKIKRYTWYLNEGGYAVASTKRDVNGQQKGFFMHRLIMNIDDPEIEVDHIDRNRLNNRKKNLRFANDNQQSWNRSCGQNKYSAEYKGIYYDTKTKTFHVRLFYKGEDIYIGTFYNEISAANAYNYYAIEYFGKYVALNEVDYMEKNEWEKYKSKYYKTSKYRGVSLEKRRNNGWRVVAPDKNKKVTYVGYYKTETQAAQAYNDYMIKEHGYENIKTKLNILETTNALN